MENQIQIFSLIANCGGATVLLAVSAWLHKREAKFVTKDDLLNILNAWADEKRLVTKEALTDALNAFSDKMKLAIIEDFNGDLGFVRKEQIRAATAETQRLRDRFVSETQELKDRMRELERPDK